MAEELSKRPLSSLLVLCNVPDSKTAEQIAQTLVRRRFAACVNILPASRSVYRWQGAVESATEIPMLIKTTATTLAAATAAIRELHPDKVPEIIALPIVGGDAAYLRWLSEQCN